MSYLAELGKAMGAGLLDLVLVVGALELARRAVRAVRRMRGRRSV